jgi:hypothetical protein
MSLPIAASWYFVEPLFLLLQVPAPVCQIMGPFLRIRLIALPADVLYTSFSKCVFMYYADVTTTTAATLPILLLLLLLQVLLLSLLLLLLLLLQLLLLLLLLLLLQLHSTIAP